MQINKYIDHTLLKADATTEAIKKVCAEAREYDFASVCVNSCHAKLVSKELEGTTVKTCCVVGFPLGAMTTESKAFETKSAIENGAQEIDMVINIGAAKEGNWALVEEDIAAVKQACGDTLLKVIIETCLLTDEEKVEACLASVRAKAEFVKTSTGFSTSGANLADVKLMKDSVNGKALVKAAGGIRSLSDARAMIEAGADRLGCSAGLKIMQQLAEENK